MNTDNQDTPPKPDQLQLIIVTCKTYLQCNLNLELIAKKIILDDLIIGKKLLGIIEEGKIKNKSKNIHKKSINPLKKTSRKDFSNQCTIIVNIDNNRKLNLKIFGNGKIVITGGLSKEDGKFAVSLLKKRIENLEDHYQIIPNSKFSDHFENLSSYLKYIGKNYLIFLKFFSLFHLNVDLRLDLILNKKFVNKYLDNDIEICDPVKNNVILYDDPNDLNAYLRLIQIFNICHLYYPNVVFLDKLNHPNDPIHELIQNLYNFKSEILPLTFDKENFNNDFDVTIENYNTMFNSNFQNNRELFTQILNDKYKKLGVISSAKFEPSNYQGINVKYISRILCNPNCTSQGKKKNVKCLCKEISFLIFQEGNIIITGGRSWDQLIDGYNVITKILNDEYQNIVVEKNTKLSNKNLPNVIVRQEYIYLNKKKFLENPRNVYLLKNIGLLKNYISSP